MESHAVDKFGFKCDIEPLYLFARMKIYIRPLCRLPGAIVLNTMIREILIKSPARTDFPDL
jgi:hypothetical protein